MVLEEDYLRYLAGQASFISERIESSLFQCTETKESEYRIDLWKRKVGKDRFLKRLKLEHLSLTDAARICGDVSYIGKELPAWEFTLKEVASYLPADAAKIKASCYLNQAESPHVRYIQDCILIFVYYARQNLEELESTFTLDALNCLYQGLADWLTSIAVSVLQMYSIRLISGEEPETEAMTAEDRIKLQPYCVLFSGAYKKLWRDYPVLTRLLCENTSMWIKNVRIFANRIYHDFGASCRVCKLAANISDPHADGKSAFIAEFGNGRKIVYKPHSLDMDTAWQDFCIQVNQITGCRLCFAQADNKDDYGYTEFINYETVSEKEQAEQFFMNAGMLLCAVHFLYSSDMHYENLIEKKENLYIIDTETLLNKRTPDYHIEHTGMLRNYITFSGKIMDDYGGITNKKDHTFNLPVIDGQYQSAAGYVDSLCRGFELFYRRFMETDAKNMKNPFCDCSPRYVVRNTRTYSLLLEELSSSRFLCDGFLFSCEIEKLSKACLDQNFPIYLSERKALLKTNIPVFYHKKNTCDLYDDCQNVVAGFFQYTPSEAFQLDFLSEEDLEYQLTEIRRLLNQEEREMTDMNEIFFNRLLDDKQ